MNPNKGLLLFNKVYFYSELDRIAEEIINILERENKLWLFDAEMGAGKTTLIARLSAALGSEALVSSPTYGFINIYECKKISGQIYHIDAYRLESEEEAINIGIEDYLFDDKNYCMVEWPSRIEDIIPENYIYFHLVKISDIQREITIYAVS